MIGTDNSVQAVPQKNHRGQIPIRDVLSLAFRNLSRHRVKTIITVTGVAISVTLYIFMDAWLLGMNLDSRRNIVSYEIGAAKIQSRAYFEKRDDLPMYESFSPWQPLVSALEKAGYSAAPRMVFTGTMHSRSGSAPFVFYGVDPEAERRVLRYQNFIEQGRFPAAGAFELAIGFLAAEKLRIGIPPKVTGKELQEELEILARTPEEAEFIRGLYEPYEETQDTSVQATEEQRFTFRRTATAEERNRFWEILRTSGWNDVRIATVIDLRDSAGRLRHVYQVIDAVVVGVINSPNPKTNGNVGYIPLDVLPGETGLLLENQVTEILIRRADAEDGALPGAKETPEAIRAALKEQGFLLPPDLEVYGWIEYVQDYIAASRGDEVTTRIMILLLFILSFLGIGNTMLMAILERTKEMGMLRALGMTDGELLLSYVVEAGMIGLIGGIIGMVLGSLVNIPMVNYGIDYSVLAREMGGDFGYRIATHFRSAWNFTTIVGSGIVATLVAALVSIPPTLRALKAPVTESLRFE